MKISFRQFGGLVPRLNAELLGGAQAQAADGCSLKSGKMVPLASHLDAAVCPEGTQTIFLRNGVWLSWPGDVDVAETPVSNDEFDRLYLSGDGVPKVIGTIDGVDQTFRLGVPAPADVCTATARAVSAVRWYRVWHYQYEEPDGTVTQSGDLDEGSYGGATVQEVIPGQSYRIAAIPAKVSGVSAEAAFVAYFDGYTIGDVPTYLGRVYPDTSLYIKQTDLYVDGALVSLAQVVSSAAPQAVFSLSFDTSRESVYRKERIYVYTYLTRFGEESAPSLPSELIEVSPVQEVLISGLPTVAPDGYENVVTKRLYRSVTSDAGTYYQMVGDVDLADATFLDFQTDAQLLSVLATTDWSVPPEDLKGLCMTPDGVACGFTDYAVHFSEPYRPHAWPAAYQFEIQSKVVAVKPVGAGVVVLTTDQPEVIQGATPSAMQRLRIPVPQGCVSKRGAVVFGDGVVYPTPDTIGMINGATFQDIGAAFFSRESWQELSPETIQAAAVHDNQLLLYSEAGSLLADLADGVLVSDAQTEPTAFFHDAENDRLYFAEGGKIRQWRGGDDAVTASWQSKTFVFERPVAPFRVQVDAAGWPVTVRFYADGVLTLSVMLLQASQRKLPVLRRARTWSFAIESSGEVSGLTVSIGGGE